MGGGGMLVMMEAVAHDLRQGRSIEQHKAGQNGPGDP